MQVSVEAGNGLERKVTVQVPAETVEAEVNNRLNSMKNTVKMDGFRPGKVPLRVIKQKYSGAVLQEVATDLMRTSFREAISQENLTPAGDPVIDAKDLELGKVMEYTATFEIFPEIALGPVDGLEVEKVESEVVDTDIDNMLDTLRKQKMEWVEADRASADGDQVTIDFVGSVDGEKFDGGSANDVPMVIGSGQMIPGFEEKLTGIKAGEDTTFNVTFPEDYNAENLAGKEAEFAVTVKKVEQPQLPEVDEEFARTFGVEDGDVARFKAEVKDNMERELNRRLRTLLKENVMDALLKANDVEVPSAVVAQEAEVLKQQTEQQMPGRNLSADDFMSDAKRRVQLGMLLAEVAKQSAINVTADDVKARVEEMAKDYDDPSEFVRYYMGNQDMLRSIETLVMEDKVVDWIADQAKVTSKSSSFDEVMNPELSKS